MTTRLVEIDIQALAALANDKDRLAARLAAVEMERDEAVALLRDGLLGYGHTISECDCDHCIALRRLAKPQEEAP